MRDLTTLRGLAIGGFVAAALVLASCGGGTSHAATVPTTTPGNNTQVAGGNGQGGFGSRLSSFRDCMSQHGITLPQRNRNGNGGPPSTTPGDTRPPGGFGGFGGGFANRFKNPPPGVDPTKYQAALKACQSTLPTGGGNFQNNSAFQAYASCLKDHGVTLPKAGSGQTFNRNDPKYASAFKICAPLRPNFGGGTTPTTGASTN